MSLLERVDWRDIVVLLAVPVVLVFVHILPQSLRVSMMMNYSSPSVVTMYTTHFVHANWGHLAGNVAVYLVAVTLSYTLFSYADSRLSFLLGFAGVLLFVPLPLSAFDLWMLGSEVGDVYSRGFSGLAAAYVGFLPVAVFVFLGNELSHQLRAYESMGLFLLSLGVIVAIYDGVTSAVTWVAIGASLLYYVRPVLNLNKEERGRFWEWSVWKRSLVLYTVLFFLVSPVILFPSSPSSGNSLVNVVTHFGGYVVGYLLCYMTLFAVQIPVDRIDRYNEN